MTDEVRGLRRQIDTMTRLASAREQRFAMVCKERDDLKAILLAMLDAYWGDGDGDPPPKFIADAQNAVADAQTRNAEREA